MEKTREATVVWLQKKKRMFSHYVREAYRCTQWNLFAKDSQRHDIKDLREAKAQLRYDDKRAKRARELANDGTTMARSRRSKIVTHFR